ncbi:MAG: phage holin family protein [Verrucomicrobiota bacterium]
MMDLEVSRLKSLLRALALYAEARGRLLQIEAQEAGVKFTLMIVLAALAAGLLLCGWLLAVPAIIWLISHTQGWPWWKVALGAAGAHLFLGLLFLLRLRSLLRRLQVFEETFKQFQRDREWLSGNSP